MRPFYRASHYGMKNSVGYHIRRTANLVLPQMELLFADEDLTFSQWTVLMVLREWGETTSAEIARNICHDAGSLTRILDELEARNVIVRARSETDRRVVAVRLTSRGLALVEKLLARVVEFWNGLLGGFTQQEVKQLLQLLTRLTAAAEGVRDRRTERAATPRRARPAHKTREKSA